MVDNKKVVSVGFLETVLPALEHKIKSEMSSKLNTSIEPLHDDIPKIYISGEVPTKKENVKATIEYVSKTHKFTTYLKYKLQGSYTLTLPKKNYSLQLYSDENRTVPFYQNFKNWGYGYQFVLKADYDDILHARNVVCSKLWSKVVQSRPDYDSLPDELKNAPNHGATDGFPVIVYINGEWKGLYSLTITKSPFMFGMDKNNPNHVALNARFNDEGRDEYKYNPCNFNAQWSGESDSYWQYEVGSDALESWNKLYTYLYEQPNAKELEKYLDIQSAIDYYIFQEVIMGADGLGKNMMLLTYDKTKWYISAYDMDGTFGILGNYFIDWDLEIGFGSVIDNGLNRRSELWYFLIDNYMDRMVERYQELRANILSYSSIIREFEDYIEIYGEDLYIKDAALYPEIPMVGENNIHFLRLFIPKRFEYTDWFFENL